MLVEQIDEASEWLNIVFGHRANAMQLLDHLDRGILAKAFRGELVPQNPYDEPAQP